MNATIDSWWTPTRLDTGEGMRWRIGPLELALLRMTSEWHVAWASGVDDGSVDSGSWSREAISELPELKHMERFAAGEAADELRLQPVVADRSLVARPRSPLFVLPGEQARVYVSSPLWVDIRVGAAARTLREVPVKRLSDTWFGPSTREGVVAYVLKTHARARLEEVLIRPYRCITPVMFRNRGRDVLLVDRLNLPIPYLALYEDDSRQFWTQAVALSRTTDDQLAELHVQGGPPSEASGAELVSEARSTATPNLLVRAFSTLMRTFGEED